MANYNTLKSDIQQYIKQNGNGEITGNILQQRLINIINALGKGYQFIGVVEPDTEFTPGDEKIVAIGFTPGTYEDFGGVELEEGKFAIFTYDGEWGVSTHYFVSQAQLGLKQNKTDNSLVTLSKQVVGAINENKQRIDNLFAIGRYLAIWNAATGLPTSNPSGTPYPYKAGDWFLVGVIADEGGTNYMPNGTEYTGEASTTPYTEDVPLKVGDRFFFDGTTWKPLVATYPEDNNVKYDEQTLTPTQQAQARTNINAADLKTIVLEYDAGKITDWWLTSNGRDIMSRPYTLREAYAAAYNPNVHFILRNKQGDKEDIEIVRRLPQTAGDTEEHITLYGLLPTTGEQIRVLYVVLTASIIGDTVREADINLFEKGAGLRSVAQKGGSNVASGDYTFVEGSHNTAQGNYSHAEGSNNIAGNVNAHVEGLNCQAIGERSHAEGSNTIANGNQSHTEGYHTLTSAGGDGAQTRNAHAEGAETICNNKAEHAEGQFNVSHRDNDTYGLRTNTQHSVGIGTSVSNRKNAFEIMQNGDIYVFGIGGYDGTNAGEEDALTLQQVLTNLGVN